MAMTADAKRALSSTIRALRERLLEDLHNATEGAYRLSIHKATDAGLSEAARKKRERLKDWTSEQLRAQTNGRSKGKEARTAGDFRREAEAQAAYTLLNRLVFLRLLETPGPDGTVRSPAVVTGGADSRGYQDFRELAPALIRDDSEGYELLLRLVFEDLATDLPGLFGPAGVADLIPIPAATLRHVVEALNDPALDTCFTDDMTLGWVYQYWNDPARKRLDDKLNPGTSWGSGKIEPHEIASKTQMFTERYMVDWLLQNSLGPMWLAMCKKHNWPPDVCSVHPERGEQSEPQSKGHPELVEGSVLERLETRRIEWRKKRESGEVSLTALMPLHNEAERRWAYYVPQPIPDDAVAHAPDSVRDLRILDPAVGSGHFLVVAMDLLFALYCEESRHRGESDDDRWSDRAIVERILSHNLHGIDLDPRAVQIAAAALWLKAKKLCPDASPERLNLVASNLRLASLPDNDPALVELRREVERETGIPAELTDTIVNALSGADHLGSLLKIDRAVEDALDAHEKALESEEADLFAGVIRKRRKKRITPSRDVAKTTLLDRIEIFLAHHTAGDDLGLRLRGEQLATGVRFARMVREGTYDLVVANPPYQGTAKMADATYIADHYKLGKADLYAAFLLRGLELVRKGGISAMLTMRNWMFLQKFSSLRQRLLESFDLRALGDFEIGAFEEVDGMVVSVCVSVVSNNRAHDMQSVAVKLTLDENERSGERTHRKRAATLCHVGRHEFDPAALKVVPEWPLVYWWDVATLRSYQSAPVIGDVAPARAGLQTSDNPRFLRKPWEPKTLVADANSAWAPYIKGAAGRCWMEALDDAVWWRNRGLEIQTFELGGKQASRPQNQAFYFRRGVAFSMIGASFSARVHSCAGIFGNKGSSVFPEDLPQAVCAMNSSRARNILQSLNPGIGFEVGDVNRLPLFPIDGAEKIFATIERAFGEHEAHREPSLEFKRPGPSPWRRAQEWAQAAVDRPEGAPLPPYEAEYDPEPATDHLSFALGVALGRFGPNGEGILDPATLRQAQGDRALEALPAGILFLDGTLEPGDDRDSLGHPAAAPLVEAWKIHGADITTKRDSLRDYLALDFFKDVHKGMYENRPIHWPLSSAKKTFVAWVNIHRMTERTLTILRADHLEPALRRLDGELSDLRAAREGADAKAARAAEKQYDRVLKARDELSAFIADVEQCADRGAPPPDAKCTPRDHDARYAPDLDDGVMINSAALWPLLDPQWSDPKKWWKTLAAGKGKKHYDWAHLAMRYWPDRVDNRCKEDPSLAVAHRCFWRYHPARAWAWELRLQDEIAPDFRIQEPPYHPGHQNPAAQTDPPNPGHPHPMPDTGDTAHRQTYLRQNPQEALAAIEKEATRRRKALIKSGAKGDKAHAIIETMTILEPGLWSAIPDQVWATELRLAQKQQSDFRLLSPDEPQSRQAYHSAHPEKARSRHQLLATFTPAPTLFDKTPAPKPLIDS